MNELQVLARLLLIAGLVLVVAGGLFFVLSRLYPRTGTLQLGLPRLPGDILIQRRNLVVFIPIVSALLLSLVLTIVFNLLLRR